MLGGLAAAGAHVGKLLLAKGDAAGLDTAGFVLELILTGGITAPHGLDVAGLVCGDVKELLVIAGNVGLLFQVLENAGGELLVHLIEHQLHLGLDVVEADKLLLTGHAADEHTGIVLNIAGADLQTDGNALHLVLAELPAGRVVGIIQLDAQTGFDEAILQCAGGLENALLVLGGGDDDHLNGCNARRQDKTGVVAVGHDDGTDHTGGNTPGGLVGMLQGVISVGEGDAEGLGKAGAEIMGGAALQGNAVVHHGLDGVGLLGARKLLLFGLAAGDGGNGEGLAVEVLVDLEHLQGLLAGLFLGGMHGVTFLPKELGGAQEGTGGLLPADNVAPLVVELGQVAVGLNNVLIVLAEEGLGGGADDETLGQIGLAADGDDGALGCKTLDVILFLFQQALGDEHGHVDVLVTKLLEAGVEILLDVFPDGIAVGTDDHAALNAGIVHQLSLFDHVGIPLAEILLHRGDLFNKFLIVCHFLCTPIRCFD